MTKSDSLEQSAAGGGVFPEPWPRAYPVLHCEAGFKLRPADFEVDEVPGVVPDGAGEHLYLRIEKRGRETRQVALELARCYGVASVAVGYAGMKDKHAVTRQWFSVHTPLGAEIARGAGLAVLNGSRHARKLRRGQLRANAFSIRLRGVTGNGWQRRLDTVATDGVPNYFGPQRFGGDNLIRARKWLPARRRRSTSRFEQGLYLSVLRSYLFNEVLARRVGEDCWRELLPGDVAQGPYPTGPLWGRGRTATAGRAAQLESAALAPHGGLCDGLEHAGLEQQRRGLVLVPENLSWEVSGSDAMLRFRLPPGAYATSLLREVFTLKSRSASVAGTAQDAEAGEFLT